MREQGLYKKYQVTKTSTGEEVEGVFILKPDTDPIAIAALQKYAELTEDELLAGQISEWLEALELMGSELPTKCDYCEDIAKVKSSPFMGDAGASMCKCCWDITREEYRASHGEEIGEF
ncbi:hypothetical protein FZD47_25455 [Bacillus infantis]|uniref:Uncharacterized protein n=1 Tax=Bacillus infantis TaxID=324767 RepID=A0A5D4S1S4_9BACI|nr:hypothetical protein [Bacillus infantis]TYS55776.1 hypothetical protein FZD47_25455 [Bacillus infantis]